MRKTCLFVSLLGFGLSLFLAPLSFGFESKGQDCSKCHTLNKEEAQTLLQNMIAGAKILEIRLSAAKAFWEVFVESGGRKGIVYIDLSKKYLMFGNLFSLKDRRNLSQESYQEFNKVDVSQIPLDDALVMGDPKAKIRIVAFDDPDCPYCAKLHQEMKKIVEERKDIAFFIKFFPLKSHAEAYSKAKAIMCEKSLALLEDAHAQKPIPKPTCETTVIDESIKLAEKLGLSSVPTLILPDGKIIPGYKDAQSLLQLIGN